MKRFLLLVVAALGCAKASVDDTPDGGFSLTAPSTEAGIVDGCGQFDVDYTQLAPTVVFLVDGSQSMSEPFGDSTRYITVQDVLSGPHGVVRDFQDRIRFGATIFNSKGGFAGGACPMLGSTPIALGNADAIRGLLVPYVPNGDTPTGASLDATARTLASFRAEGPKYIVLLTDGEPDTCEVPNPQEGQDEAVAAAQIAFSRGIGTVIVSVGTGVSAVHQQMMANAGAGLSTTDTTKSEAIIVATQPDALKSHLADIVDRARACSFTLAGKVLRPERGTVRFDDGPALGYQDPNGWRIVGDDTLQLVGDACAEAKTGAHDLHVQFWCDAFIR